MHGICGFWGVLAVGIFDKDVGLLHIGSVAQLEIQLLGGLVLMLWSTLFCGIFFKILSSIGRFRVSHVYEGIGIDLLMHQSIDELKHHPIVQSATFQKNFNRVGNSYNKDMTDIKDMLNYKKDADL